MKIGIKNYKGFGDEISWFERRKITVLVGKNNSGKSSVLEIIQSLCSGKTGEFSENRSHLRADGTRTAPELFIEDELDETILKPVFRQGVTGGRVPGIGDHWEFGQRYIGIRYCAKLENGRREVKEIYYSEGNKFHKIETLDGNYFHDLGKGMKAPYSEYEFLSLSAEREIKPEGDNPSPHISPNGEGLVNAIQVFLNYDNYPAQIVEKDILNALNEVFKPDHYFTRIIPQLNQNGMLWEIYLEEDDRRIPLSNSGAGIKTVLLVLGLVYLMPQIKRKNLTSFVLSLEELENNLHPSLLRRLLGFLKKLQEHYDFEMFLTTHSNVSIDFFSESEDSQIVHVKKNDGVSGLISVRSFSDSKNILHDLDIRASDLLQSNGIIWVEGPSDRTYINHFISIWSDNQLKEGIHYQCLFYSGRTLSHFSANDESDESFVDMLKINSNAAILMDSDIKVSGDQLNSTKKRLIEDFKTINGLSWITKGREIENYLPKLKINELLNVNIEDDINGNDSFFDILDNAKDGEGRRLKAKKVELAQMVCESTSKSDWHGILDLDNKVLSLVSEIKGWNSM